jgi:hypothetical protein
MHAITRHTMYSDPVSCLQIAHNYRYGRPRYVHTPVLMHIHAYTHIHTHTHIRVHMQMDEDHQKLALAELNRHAAGEGEVCVV